MNTKEMMAAIVTAMLVMTMFASSAMATITVDGNPSDWDPSDKLCDDEDIYGGNPYVVESSGYNITSLWACIENGVFYARMDMIGVTGDADGDGNDTTTTHGPNTEWPGVGEGTACDNEQYYVIIDADNGGSSVDYILKYCSGGSRLENISGTIYGATTDAAHAGHTVEISVVLNEHCDIDPTGYCVEGWADTQTIGNEDWVGPVCRTNDPPEARFNFTPGDCGEGRLDATASTDDGTIEKYEWDFDNDSVYDDATGDVVDPYTIGGPNYVCLKVTDNLGQSNITCQWVLLTDCPIAVAKADGDEGPTIQLPAGGKMVEFNGTDSYHPDYPDAWIVSYAWVIGSKTSDQCTVSFFIDQDTTAKLTVTDNFGCKATDTITLIMPLYKPPSDVPILTPIGMVALIGMLCIVGAGRILTKGRRS
jgi:hypothetical protein